ncbi:hypothetical protein BU16DRAFT_536944 [Lophium mytilinum]|uniref:Uncharacterized protein n=1 Tax=Lophium mytilinum TaxID=390894 RepID=A0A6A6R3R3_9PEZI|nr:hypothetical protein BU16DRAFT_536944 [Lophium mytilinum]
MALRRRTQPPSKKHPASQPNHRHLLSRPARDKMPSEASNTEEGLQQPTRIKKEPFEDEKAGIELASERPSQRPKTEDHHLTIRESSLMPLEIVHRRNAPQQALENRIGWKSTKEIQDDLKILEAERELLRTEKIACQLAAQELEQHHHDIRPPAPPKDMNSRAYLQWATQDVQDYTERVQAETEVLQKELEIRKRRKMILDLKVELRCREECVVWFSLSEKGVVTAARS